jgi:hypothetical protein
MVGILDVIGVLNPIIDRVFPDPKDKLELQEKLATLADQEAQRDHENDMGQIATNNIEAASPSMFVAGWRPAIGWVGAFGLAYSFVVEPLSNWTARVVFHYADQLPNLDSSQLMTLVLALLGFGGLRTYEKVQGIPDSKPNGTNSAVPASQVQVAPASKKLKLPWPF